jgi:hypothetical protein
MADQAVDDSDVFFYMGGRAPQHVMNVIIDESVTSIDDEAFYSNPNLRSVQFHAGVKRIGRLAFYNCPLLRQIKLPGVKLIEEGAFDSCSGLEDVDCKKLETIDFCGFQHCTSLRNIMIPSVRTIRTWAFSESGLTDAEFGKELEEIGLGAFKLCGSLRRIAIPLKDNMFIFNDVFQTYAQFDCCKNLTTVDLVGGIHRTLASGDLYGHPTMFTPHNRLSSTTGSTLGFYVLKIFKLTAVGSLHEVELNAHGPNSVDHNLFVRTIITTSLSV